MDVLKAIKARRSVHHFKQKEVDEETIRQIFTYGSWAPTHYLKEPWEIKIYQEKGKQAFVESIINSYQRIGMIKTDNNEKTLNTIKTMSDFLLCIPHHALIYFKKEKDPIRYEEDYSAVAAFIQNIQLAAWTYGVGMLWTITPFMHDKAFVEEIGLDSGMMKIAAVMQFGYPKRISDTKGRTKIDEKLSIIKE